AQSNYDGAIQLLQEHQKTAGPRADGYAFWLGQAYFKKGDYTNAAHAFETLARDFPKSEHRLEAAVDEASAFVRAGQWPGAIELLERPDGVFKSVAATNGGSELVVRGYLILGEAQLAEKKFAQAEATLKPFQKRLLSPTNSWQWQYLLCRLQLAQGKLEASLSSATNLMAMASNTLDPALEAESISFEAGLLEKLGRLDAAAAAYARNLRGTTPPEQQREALLKISSLCLKQNQPGEAVETLEHFLAEYPQAPLAPRAWFELGELRLKQFLLMTGETNHAEIRQTAAGTNQATAARELQLAEAAYQTLLKNYSSSPLVPNAFLELGWTRWVAGDWNASFEAFHSAFERLTNREDRLVAQYKMADLLLRQTNAAAALTNYEAVTKGFQTPSAAATNLLEPALYQTIRAGLAVNNLSAVTNALEKIFSWFPDSFRTKSAVLLAGQALTERGDPSEARAIFSAFIQRAGPKSEASAEASLAIGRSYERERDWARAAQVYQGWLGRYTNSPLVPDAEYQLALATFQTGNETNALSGFTNFLARFPTNHLAPWAERWVADFYYNHGEYSRAENDYQLLSRNWPGTSLAYEGRMMAGRAAMRRYGWSDASDYFLKLWNDTNSPVDLRFQALFALGDVYMSQDSTNKAADYAQAIGIFDRICQSYGTNRLGALAWGEKASCYLQWAQAPDQLTNAVDAFENLIKAPAASITARSIARVGLGVVLERQAGQSPAAEQLALRRRALDAYLDVLSRADLREGELPDLFWIKESGLKAVRLASDLQEWSIAERACGRLIELLPQLRPSLEQRLLKLRAQQGIARARG
ncbi:MAG TPA: tetratricopeptide repeat protein, partial [Verrucomicrobiae bacterium]|nr:tetratricopeptide repeat protein [Verrucomicrobiae bacterium]